MAALSLLTTGVIPANILDACNTLIQLMNTNLPQVVASGLLTANGATAVTVTTSAIQITDVVVFGLNTVGGTVGAIPTVKTITAGTQFTIAGTASDTSVYNWRILRF